MKLWKKGLAALTAGLLCLGSVGLSGVELPASADVPYFYDGTYGDLYYDVIEEVLFLAVTVWLRSRYRTA